MGDIGVDDSPGPFINGLSKSQEKSKISSYRSSGTSIAIPIKRDSDPSNFDQNLNWQRVSPSFFHQEV
jgi:hypothetical protein